MDQQCYLIHGLKLWVYWFIKVYQSFGSLTRQLNHTFHFGINQDSKMSWNFNSEIDHGQIFQMASFSLITKKT